MLENQNKITIDKIRKERINTIINKGYQEEDIKNNRIDKAEEMRDEKKAKKRGRPPKNVKKMNFMFYLFYKF